MIYVILGSVIGSVFVYIISKDIFLSIGGILAGIVWGYWIDKKRKSNNENININDIIFFEIFIAAIFLYVIIVYKIFGVF